MSPSSLECTNCNILANWLQYFCLQSPSSVYPFSPSKISMQNENLYPTDNILFFFFFLPNKALCNLWGIFEGNRSDKIPEGIFFFFAFVMADFFLFLF